MGYAQFWTLLLLSRHHFVMRRICVCWASRSDGDEADHEAVDR